LESRMPGSPLTITGARQRCHESASPDERTAQPTAARHPA
jgi:hypothetical protein